MTTDNFCFYLQNTLIQTSQTGGHRYSDTSPFSIPCRKSSKQSTTQHIVYEPTMYCLLLHAWHWLSFR